MNSLSQLSRAGLSALLPFIPAVLVSVGFWLAVQGYFVPITRGGDRNAYLLGGRMLAEGHFTGITPPDPYVNYGQHWVETQPGRLALKFPLGLPAIYALIHWLGGAANWAANAHQLSLIAASLAVFGSFVLMEPIVGSFYALLGSLLLAASPVTFFFANIPNSHATALCVAVWGMTMLISWWRNGGAWRAIVAGLIIGFNFTVRYTEGLLLLPLLLVVIFAKRHTPSPGNPGDGWGEGFEKTKPISGPHPGPLPDYRERGKYSHVLPLVGWLIPVFAQCVYNLIVLHHLTGYGLTHESTAFSLSNFSQNWPTMLADLYDGGLFFILPLSLLGALLMMTANRRLAIVLWSWFLPPLLLYSSYYWTPDEAGPAGVHYLRFVLTIVPALALCALWLPRALDGNAAALGTGIIVAISVVGETRLSTSAAAEMQWTNLGASVLEQEVARHVPSGSLIFGQGGDLIMLQVAGDWRLYSSDLFTARYVRSFAAITGDNPQGLQPRRARELSARLGGKTDDELADEQNRLIQSARNEGRRVFAVLPHDACEEFLAHFKLQAIRVDRWQVDGRWRGQPFLDMQLMEIQVAAKTQRTP